jgi:hypothetical protein
MRIRFIFIGSLVCFLISCSNNSTAPQKLIPDLIIQDITYTYGQDSLFLKNSIKVCNIGSGDFNGILYIASASAKYYREYGSFTYLAFLDADTNIYLVKTSHIGAGQFVQVARDAFMPRDTNVVIFRIVTDNKFTSDSGMFNYPVYEEANYGNNLYALTLH